MNSNSSFDNEPAREEFRAPVVVNENRSKWGPALGIGLVAVAAFSFYQYSQVRDLRQELNNRQKEAAEMQAQVAANNSSLSGTVNDLQSQLSTEQQKTTQSIAKVQDTAKKHADTVAHNVQATLEEKNAAQQEAMNQELSGVKNATSDASSRIDGVNAAVDTVKTDLASTKTVADKTAVDLQRATGDMGVMSGLVATNSKQIQELRDLGDRNIFEFNITKKAGIQKVGDVQIRLTKVDVKRNKYTMVVVADDKLIEKKDRNTNEPVQFYATPGSRTPYEIVVNDVDKDSIKGYLATPKLTTARR